jgi:hypothetical protein
MKKTIVLPAAAFLICSAVIVFAGHHTTGHETDNYALEISSGEKLLNTIEVPRQPRGGFVYTFSIYRVPEDQAAQTLEGERIYAFQILPSLDYDSVNVEVVALLEDPKTVSEEHPLHKFKKQSLGFYNIRFGESVTISEMMRLKAKPLTLKVVVRS